MTKSLSGTNSSVTMSIGSGMIIARGRSLELWPRINHSSRSSSLSIKIQAWLMSSSYSFTTFHVPSSSDLSALSCRAHSINTAFLSDIKNQAITLYVAGYPVHTSSWIVIWVYVGIEKKFTRLFVMRETKCYIGILYANHRHCVNAK